MTFDEFKDSLKNNQPPKETNACLKALWWDAKDDWDQAHRTAQDVSNTEGSWVHAYLHRKEGDIGNASYWYSLAGKPRSDASLESEWEDIVKTLLGDGDE